MIEPDACRFCRIYAVSLLAFAGLVGSVAAAQLAVGLGKLGGQEAVSRVLSLGVVRSTAPGASGSALLLALVLWAHPLPLTELNADLKRILKRGVAISVPGYLVAVVVALVAAFAVASGGLGQSFSTFRAGLTVVGWRDIGVGALGTLLDAALTTFLAWRYIARLQSGRMSLPAKLILVLTVTVPLRATVALLFSSLLSA